jgi:26S proteasome regulatory subunit N1
MSPKDEEKAIKITVESKDPKEKEPTGNKNNQDSKDNEPVMSEEDQELKERVETCVSTLINKESEDSVTVPLRLKALDVIVTELRSATSSMTSVPKPLKFLRPHFTELKNLHISLERDISIPSDSDYILLRARLADVLSVLAMTMGDDGKC